MKFPFPRLDDGLGHAWGLRTQQPHEIWERFSENYEAQAEVIWNCFENLGFEPVLDWAGSEDGEAIIGRDADGEIIVLYHLENPEQALALQDAVSKGELLEFVEDTIDSIAEDAAFYTRLSDR